MTDSSPKRLPIRIRLPYATQAEFIARYGANVDAASIFIATKAAKPVGTLLSFELVLADGTRLMRGEGEVAATVLEGAGARPGMKVHFTRIDQQTRSVVDAIVQAKAAPAAAEAAPVAPEAPAEPPKPIEPPEPVVAPEPVAPVETPAPVTEVAPPAPVIAAPVPSAPSVRPVSNDIVFGFAVLPTSTDIAIHRDGGARRLGALPSTANSFATEALKSSLLSLKSAVEDELNCTVLRAVVAVPSTTSARERAQLADTLKAAGLECLRIIHVPAALALAFAGGRTLARKRMLVLAEMAGVLDVAACHITGDECEIISTVTTSTTNALNDIKQMLERAKITATSLDELILVDANAALRSELEQLVGKAARSDIDSAAISHGAALMGSGLVMRERGKPAPELSELLGEALSFANRAGQLVKIFEQQTRVPADKNLALPAKNGAAISLLLMHGQELATAAPQLAVTVVPDRDGEIALRFRLDADGKLSVNAESATGRPLPCTTSTDFAPEQIQALLAAAPDFGTAASAPKGLFSGLKKMFGR